MIHLLRFTRQHNEYGLMQYIVPPMLFCHLTAAQAERPTVEWPKAQADAARRQSAAAELVRGWGSALSPEVAQSHCRASLMLVSQRWEVQGDSGSSPLLSSY